MSERTYLTSVFLLVLGVATTYKIISFLARKWPDMDIIYWLGALFWIPAGIAMTLEGINGLNYLIKKRFESKEDHRDT